MKTWVYHCRFCGHYKTTKPGEWVKITAREFGFLLIFIDKIEIHETICPDCEENVR